MERLKRTPFWWITGLNSCRFGGTKSQNEHPEATEIESILLVINLVNT